MFGFQIAHVPDDTLALATLSLDGDSVQVNYRTVQDVIQPPRRQVARALRLLADHLDLEADALDG